MHVDRSRFKLAEDDRDDRDFLNDGRLILWASESRASEKEISQM